MIYGYARVSTARQNLDRQINNIRAAYPDADIKQEKYTGTKMSRPVWSRLCARLQSGDTVVFDSVSRMSRDAAEGFEVYQNLYSDGINLVFLKEPYVNTDTFRAALAAAVPMTGTSVDLILQGVNAYLMEIAKEQIKIAFEQSEKEVTDLHKRVSEGMKIAKENGAKFGGLTTKNKKLITKKSIAAKEIIKEHSIDFGGSLRDANCIILCGVSRNTFYKYKRELQA